MADTRTKEEREADWWAAWWKEDFSWDGLAKKQLKGWVVADGLLREKDTGRLYGQPAPDAPAPAEGRTATLQDYWRADPGTGRLVSDANLGDQLVSANGQPVFHRIHLPLAWPDGTPSGKADWPDAALDALIAARLIAATETKWEGESWNHSIVGGDGRAQFGGAVLLAGLSHPQGMASPLSVDCTRTVFVRRARFDGATFSGDARFYNAAFSGDAGFGSATFSGDASFDSASVSGDAGFGSATFSGNAGFYSSTFSGDASFDSASFSGDASFDGGTFRGYARFSRATFSGAAGFYKATFSGAARFYKATFSGAAHFHNAAFQREAGFDNATFSGGARFDDATFSEDANFDSATFSGDVLFFFSATFSGDAGFGRATFSGDVGFDSATFSGDAGFGRATFSGDASFGRATFSGDASFLSATFSGRAGFGFARFEKTAWFVAFLDEPNAVFGGPADFSNAIFDGAAQFEGAEFKARMTFDTAIFRRFADFARVTLPGREPDWRGGFDGALFEATLDARGIDAKGVSLFAGARFDRGVMLERIDEQQERAAHMLALEAACAADDREVALRALESGALKLKQAMEAEKDYSREQRFHRLELRAKRKRKDTPWTEKAFSGAYLTFARYGGSIGVPAAWLIGAIAVFACLYWSLEQGPGRVVASVGRIAAERSLDPNLVEAARYSLSRVFPLGTWDDSDEPVRVVVDEAKRSGAAFDVQADCSFRERLVAAGGCRPAAMDFRSGASGEDRSRLELHRTFIAMLSTLQTVFAGALYFLLGLAVRRKFQIS